MPCSVTQVGCTEAPERGRDPWGPMGSLDTLTNSSALLNEEQENLQGNHSSIDVSSLTEIDAADAAFDIH